MPGYVERALQRFAISNSPETYSPHAHTVPHYGAKIQMTNPDTSTKLDKAASTTIREVVGVFLYYARAIDNTMLVALGTIASQQSNSTEATADATINLLNYAATNPDASLRYHASDMILHIHSDASYLSESEARSRAAGFFYLSSHPDKLNNNCPPLNGALHIHSSIMRNVMASSAEAEVGAAYLGAQEACGLRTTLADMGYPQPPTPIITDNNVAQGILNDTVKQKRSKAIDMRFYWLRDRIQQGQFIVHWKPATVNMADYYSKHFSPNHHIQRRPLHLHTPSSKEAYATYEQLYRDTETQQNAKKTVRFSTT